VARMVPDTRRLQKIDPYIAGPRRHSAAAWVEYANGSTRRRWAMRAANGQTEPYRVEWWVSATKCMASGSYHLYTDQFVLKHNAFARGYGRGSDDRSSPGRDAV
jgi:hypothetical protein